MPMLAKSKVVRGKYFIDLPGEGTFEKRQRGLCTDAAKNVVCRKLHAKQFH